METIVLEGNKKEATLSSSVASKYRWRQKPPMSRAMDVLGRIRSALVFDAKRLREISAEMETLADAYHRYSALRDESDKREKSLHGLKALLGHDMYYKVMREDETSTIGEEAETRPTAYELRAATPLWEHVVNYLRFVSEARVGEIVDFLEWAGLDANRQAIESAIRAHPRTFAVKKKGREKFVSLKK